LVGNYSRGRQVKIRHSSFTAFSRTTLLKIRIQHVADRTPGVALGGTMGWFYQRFWEMETLVREQV
jgi:hypothetical protein